MSTDVRAPAHIPAHGHAVARWAVRALAAVVCGLIALVAVFSTSAGAARRARVAAASTAWDEPVLRSPTTIVLGPRTYNLKLDPARDYVLGCPQAAVTLPWTLSIWGGHDIVLQNCDLHVAHNWVASFKDQTGTLWIHDVHFGGRRLTGGIQLQEPESTVVMRDVLFDAVYGSYRTNHAELVQTWAGPRRLLIDGMTGSDTYQGLFLLPNQLYTGSAPSVFDLRHINIDDSAGGYALWLGDLLKPIATWNVSDVYVKPNRRRRWRGWWLWPEPHAGRSVWSHVRPGAPPGGSFVTPVTGGATGVDEGISPLPLPNEA